MALPFHFDRMDEVSVNIQITPKKGVSCIQLLSYARLTCPPEGLKTVWNISQMPPLRLPESLSSALSENQHISHERTPPMPPTPAFSIHQGPMSSRVQCSGSGQSYFKPGRKCLFIGEMVSEKPGSPHNSYVGQPCPAA